VEPGRGRDGQRFELGPQVVADPRKLGFVYEGTRLAVTRSGAAGLGSYGRGSPECRQYTSPFGRVTRRTGPAPRGPLGR
jgi:hypothetical protein